MNLDELPVGAQGRVLTVGGERTFRRRLLELGLVPGTPVERLGRTAFGDPIRVRVRDAVVALRRHDARRVLLEAP